MGMIRAVIYLGQRRRNKDGGMLWAIQGGERKTEAE